MEMDGANGLCCRGDGVPASLSFGSGTRPAPKEMVGGEGFGGFTAAVSEAGSLAAVREQWSMQPELVRASLAAGAGMEERSMGQVNRRSKEGRRRL